MENELLKLLDTENRRFDFFYFIVAYVKNTGAGRLKDAIENFRNNGGKVYAVVGIDQKNTSIQGLKTLLSVCDDVWVFHNESVSSTFHPKAYIFEKPEVGGAAIIGSSNLTAGGLSTNYEMNYLIEYDFALETDVNVFNELKRAYTYYSTPSELCKKLDDKLIEDLSADYLGDESKRQSVEEGAKEQDKETRSLIFGSKLYFPTPLKIKVGPSAEPQKGQAPSVRISECEWSSKGKIRWKKKLTKRDCQIVNPGTSPTGSLSLTSARWKDNGKLIDQVTYFRFDLFSGFIWKQARPKYSTETTTVKFCVRINGVNIGLTDLVLRYDPKWEADEHNYTTGLSWGSLTEKIKTPAMVSKFVSIYDPPVGKKEPYFIEIG